jgi:hypothetical protein
MVPASTLSVATFFLFVAPGIFYELLRRRTRHPREETTFVEVSRIVLSSVLLTTGALALLALVHVATPRALLDPATLVRNGKSYVADHLALTGWSALAEFALATLLAIVFNDLYTAPDAMPIYAISAWHGVAEREASGLQVNLSVRLKDGTEVVGHYLGSSIDTDPAKRELILGAPLHIRRSNAGNPEPLRPGWQRMVMSGGEISYLTAEYVDSGASPREVAEPRLVTAVREWLVRWSLTWQLGLSLLVLLLGVLLAVGGFRALTGHTPALGRVLVHPSSSASPAPGVHQPSRTH